MVPTRDTSTAPLAATPKLRGPVTGATTICMGRKGAQTGLGKGGNVRPRPFAPPLPLPVVLSALDHALSAALAGMVVQGTIPAIAVPCTTLPARAAHGQGFATWGESCSLLAHNTPEYKAWSCAKYGVSCDCEGSRAARRHGQMGLVGTSEEVQRGANWDDATVEDEGVLNGACGTLAVPHARYVAKFRRRQRPGSVGAREPIENFAEVLVDLFTAPGA